MFSREREVKMRDSIQTPHHTFFYSAPYQFYDSPRLIAIGGAPPIAMRGLHPGGG